MGPNHTDMPCARCGRATPVDALVVWQQVEQYRVFQGPPVRGPDGVQAARRSVYDRVRKRCAYLTCPACHDKLQAGARLGDVHNRKVAIYAAAVAAVGVLIMIWTPVVMPKLLVAFWWW